MSVGIHKIQQGDYMSDNFRRETVGSVELAEHFKQLGSPMNYFKQVRLINCMNL